MCKINWEERVFQMAKDLYVAEEDISVEEAIENALYFKEEYIKRMGLNEEYTPKEEKAKARKDEGFESAWLLYRRKGSKKKSIEQWIKLSDEEKEAVKGHIPAYIDSVSDIKYQKDFERYLRDKCFNDVVYKNNMVIFDVNEAKEKQNIESDKLIIGGVLYR
jgi:hypothetical protein